MELKFTVDTKGVDVAFGAARRASEAAITKAGGAAIRAMKTEASRKVRSRKAIKAGALQQKLTIAYPTNREVKLWRLGVPGEVMPVIAYGTARQTTKGVTVQINVGTRALIPSAFIATMRSGHVGVFRRYGQASRGPVQRYKGHARYAGQKRQPIRELYTTRVVDVFHDEGFVAAVLQRGQEVFTRDYSRLLPLELGRKK